MILVLFLHDNLILLVAQMFCRLIDALIKPQTTTEEIQFWSHKGEIFVSILFWYMANVLVK